MCHISCHCFLYMSCFDVQLRKALRSGFKSPTASISYQVIQCLKNSHCVFQKEWLNSRGANHTTGQGLNKGLSLGQREASKEALESFLSDV